MIQQLTQLDCRMRCATLEMEKDVSDRPDACSGSSHLSRMVEYAFMMAARQQGQMYCQGTQVDVLTLLVNLKLCHVWAWP